MTPDGLIVRVSKFDPKEAMDRRAAAVTIRRISIMAGIDTTAAAAVGMALRPTEVPILGDRWHAVDAGCADDRYRSPGPVACLAGRSGTTALSYNDPQWLA